MNFKKMFASIMVILVLLTAFCGCGSDEGSASGTSSVAPKEVKFATEGYAIVRKASDSVAASYGSKIFKAIKDATGLPLSNVDDTSAPNAAGEIIIGDTARPQSQKALDMLLEKGTGRAAEYIVCYIDGAIVVQGMTPESLAAAVKYFVDNYCKY